MITALSIEGGGSRALAAAGALVEIPLENLKMVIGSSSGAIIAAMLATGWPPREIRREFVSNVTEGDILDLPSDTSIIRKLWSARTQYGVNSGDKKYAWLEKIVSRYTGDRMVTFEDVDLDLAIPLTCYTTHTLFVCSRRSTPTMPIVSALMAATAIPGIFAPVRIGEAIYVDSGLMCNNPGRLIDKYYPEHVETSIIMTYDWSQQVEIMSVWNDNVTLQDYLMNVVQIPMHRISYLDSILTRDVERRTLKLPSISGLATAEVDAVTRAALARHGAQCTREFLTKNKWRTS